MRSDCAELKPPARREVSESAMRPDILKSETIDRLKHAAKTGLAAALSFYLARFLRLPESYWAAISAIIVM